MIYPVMGTKVEMEIKDAEPVAGIRDGRIEGEEELSRALDDFDEYRPFFPA